MRILFSLFIIFFTALPSLILATPAESLRISSRVAISQSGRFALAHTSLLQIDPQQSQALTNFIAYKELISGNAILLGAIPGQQTLRHLCKNPTFLQTEKIAAMPALKAEDITYFQTKNNRGCLIPLTPDRSVMIMALANPFVNQQGEKVKHIALVANKQAVRELKKHMAFTITAKDFFINLLQLSEAFSPFSQQIDWTAIQRQGLNYIGDETKTCRGLSAAARYLTPALRQFDFHSSVSTDGLDNGICEPPPVPEDEATKKWLAVPREIRRKIIEYASEFHGKQINSHFAYLYLPAIDAYAPDTIYQRVTAGRDTLNNQALFEQAKGMIIDLRFNGGGSVVPMLLTLGGVMSSGKLFNLDWNVPICLSNNGNQLLVCESQEKYGEYIGPPSLTNRGIPIAILTNGMTGSSANIVSLALRDQAVKTRVFGTPTSATTSVNATFYLLDGNRLNLMVARIYNKNGVRVPLALPVDEEIEDNVATVFDANADLTLNAAVKWLEGVSG